MVNSQTEAYAAVQAVYYPPRGRRGVGLARAQGYGATFQSYKAWLETNAVVIVQVEHVDAVTNFAAILSVPGIDGYFIGPYDLSASMGLPGQFDHPELVAAIERIKQIGAELEKPGGLHIVEPEINQLEESINQGFKFMAYSLDTRMLETACRASLKLLKTKR